MHPFQARRWLSVLAIASIGLAGCGDAIEEDAAETEGAATTEEIRSVTGREIQYSLTDLAFDPSTPGFAALRMKGTTLLIQLSAYRLQQGRQTLSVNAARGNPTTIPLDGVPTNVVNGATWRIAIFRVTDQGIEPVADPESGLNLFEHVIVENDGATFTTVTSSGEKVSGRLALPGLTTDTSYAVTAVPRNVAQGSLLGTHFFALQGVTPPPPAPL